MKPRHKFFIGFFIGGMIVCAAIHAFAAEAVLPIRAKLIWGAKLADQMQAMCLGEVDGHIHEVACEDLIRVWRMGYIVDGWEPKPEVLNMVESAGE